MISDAPIEHEYVICRSHNSNWTRLFAPDANKNRYSWFAIKLQYQTMGISNQKRLNTHHAWLRRQRTQKHKGVITVNKVQQGLLCSRLALKENEKNSFTYRVVVILIVVHVHLPSFTTRVTPASMLCLNYIKKLVQNADESEQKMMTFAY